MKSFDDKVALAHMHSKRFHVLNETASLIFNSVRAGMTRRQIEESIADDYRVQVDQVSDDIDKTLGLLIKERFISPVL